MHRVFVTSKISQVALDVLSKEAGVDLWEGDCEVPYPILLEAARKVDGILSIVVDRIDEGLIDSSPGLKVISNCAVGYDNIDVAVATKKGIPVGNTPGVLSETTADLAFGLLLAVARRIAEGDRYVRSGNWKMGCSPGLLLGTDVHHSTLGIIGMGRIGIEMALRAKGFNMKVLYHNRHRREDIENQLGVEFSPLEELLKKSDFISLHVPLNETSRKLIGPSELALMKPSAFLINTARGGVIDQKALYTALKSGKLAGAGLDVTQIEPIPLNDPLLQLENVVFTPHIGSASTATRTRMALMAVENILAGLKGEKLPYCVNPEIYKNNSSGELK